MIEKALRLLDACCEAYDSFQTPKDGHTFCNFAVDHILMRMGYDDMKNSDGTPMLANQMVDFMTRSLDWEEVRMDEAQNLANVGEVVVAGKAEEGHGHVVVVRPGTAEHSGKWGPVPKCCNVGAHSWIGRGVNYAFGGDVKPTFWRLKKEGI